MEVLRNNKEFSILYKMFEDLGITLISDKCQLTSQSYYFNNDAFLWNACCVTFSVLLQTARKPFLLQPTPRLKLFQPVFLTPFWPAKTKLANLLIPTPLLALFTAVDSFLDLSLSFLAVTLILSCLQVSLIRMTTMTQKSILRYGNEICHGNRFNLLTTTICFARFPNIDGVTVENAKIIGGDLTETEGVIHVIDAVIANKPETPSVCTAPFKNY